LISTSEHTFFTTGINIVGLYLSVVVEWSLAQKINTMIWQRILEDEIKTKFKLFKNEKNYITKLHSSNVTAD